MNIFIIVVLIGLAIFFIERFVFSPSFTDAAMRQFILDSLKRKEFYA